ncbi:MAG: diaminopimelate epimerase [Candidatus Eremiobacteraeota bacterium]|nr:diaminopimelate epimerase [Candidatus Eremiobacteraeota bacterium]
MMDRVAVTKMHGARNDFIILDARTVALDDVSSLARRLCDRHSGIGADGVLLVGHSACADASMRVINADGSEAEMCGNGVRCVARYLDERDEGRELLIETLAGSIHTVVVERGETYRVRVDVGIPHVMKVKLPLPDAVAVDIGNPHVVLFRAALGDVAELAALGEELQHNDLFPRGTNVHVAVIVNAHEMRVRHFERGAGLTMACGTGAVACVAAAIARGTAVSPVTVHVPGGELLIELDAAGRASMTGPAVHVFDTTIDVRVPNHV